ncbi:uncharacterized protein LOC110827578 isoform X2 [Zootermopsis nevadensis]|uniref:uncharacterized protein LOC110827578 isoform X2 n=1 Tax=Zootermopsis nevadensis TaxID=136037 RepID=UPI000B8E590D|nr:uncharacterized protein LOC110827578 isoform X2 [Zootermopsis nevadensis]
MTSEEGRTRMAGQEDNAVRMAGYLDKRGKMLVSTWKRYWFVLKDQLLLYYKSQLECLNLSACRGSLNMGLVSCVRPGAHRGHPATGTHGYTIEVVTRTQVVILRTKDRGLQEQWLKVLLESMALPNISTPVRTGGGPVHFRYSLENLPLEAEDKEKQKTLPHHTTVARNNSVLGRIKRMGGRSYGGSLDTILKHNPSQEVQHRSPQQPNIPRIKAVDRMLGLQQKDEQEIEDDREGQCLNNYEYTEVLKSTADSTDFENEDQCHKDSTNLLSKDRILKLDGGEEIECSDDSSQRLVAIASGSHEIKEINFKLRNDETNREITDESKNHEIFNVMCIEDAKKLTTNFLENQRFVSSLESEEVMFVENKLYEKTEEIGNGDENKIENKVNKKTSHVEADEEYDSEEELSRLQHRVSEDEKMYEVVPVNIDEMKQVQKDTEDMEEDDYYCSYDKFSLIHSLPDQNNGSSPEPDLPPRPSVGSSDSNKSQLKHQDTKTEDEGADYSTYYESTESYNTSTSSSQFLSSGGDGTPSKIKGSKLHGRIKFKKKDSPSKESVTLGDASSNGKKKRKTSFLRRMLKHHHKKPESNSQTLITSDNCSDEPEYETVDYSVPTLKQDVAEEKQQPEHAARHNSTESLDKEVPKDKWYGTKSLLTEQAMLELKMKLKVRDDSAVSTNQDIGYECISSNEVSEKKPVPTPRSRKQNSNQGFVCEASRYRCNDSLNRANKPPSLPPRRVARPHSPWHDVPKNNSPVYGNFQDLGITTGIKEDSKIKETLEPMNEKQSTAQATECVQEFQDEYLGTPRGFVYVQNKWKAAEKSGEQHVDQPGTKGKLLFQKSPQRDTFPEKCSSTEVKENHVGSEDGDSSGSDIVSHEHECGTEVVASTYSSDIYSDVHKEHVSTKTVINSLNSQNDEVMDRVSDSNNVEDKKGGNAVNCVKDETDKVNNVKLKCNVNIEQKIGSIETKHHDVSGDIIINYSNDDHNKFNINTTHQKYHSDDTVVTLRKSQSGSISMCNKHEMFLKDTKNCEVAVNYESKELPSNELRNERDRKNGTEDNVFIMNNNTVCSNIFSISTDSSAQQETKTLFNNVYNQNMLKSGITEDVCSRSVDSAETGGCEDAVPRLNRHSDELNLLLAQLAEITSAPLLPQCAATSLVDIPKGRKPKAQTDESSQLDATQPKSFVLGPIRRRRHSDPDYDVPRPHGSLLHLLSSNRMASHSSDHSESGQESDVIQATRFFGDTENSSNSTCSSLSLRHSVISEVDDQSDMSYYISMAPDSLEVPLNKNVEGNV